MKLLQRLRKTRGAPTKGKVIHFGALAALWEIGGADIQALEQPLTRECEEITLASRAQHYVERAFKQMKNPRWRSSVV